MTMLWLGGTSNPSQEEVMVTAVDVITDEQASRCQALADELGVPFRLRTFS